MSYTENFSFSKSWCYSSCRRRFSYKYRLWLKPFAKDANLESWQRLFKGQLIHAGMEAKFLGLEPAQYIDDALAEEQEKSLRQEQLDELPQMREDSLQIVDNFCEWLPIEDWEVVKHPVTGKPLIEQEVRVPLNNGVGDFLGYVDIVLRHKETGRIYVCDYKTKKQLGGEGEEDYVTQLPIYIKALKEQGIVDANMFALFEIKSTPPKRAPRKIRTDSESIDGVRESVDGAFRFVPKFCNEHYLQQTWNNFEKQSLSMSRFTHDYEFPSRSYYNCKTCEYRPLCDAVQYGHDLKPVVERSFQPNLKALAILQSTGDK